MAIYDIYGNQLNAAYDISGNSLSAAYDIEGRLVWRSGGDVTRLKVMTYNVQKFTGINAQTAMQQAIVNRYQPDIIGIQELGNSSTIPAVGQAMLTAYPYRQTSNHKNYLLSVSKALQFSNVTVADFAHQDPQDASEYNETRAYVKLDIHIDGKTVTWINTHLCYLTESVKYQQMQEVFNIAEQCRYVIITGDFNSMIMSAVADDYINMYKQFVDAGYHLANNSPDAGFQNTYTSSSTASSLADLTTAPDSIIVSGNIDIDNVVFDTTKFSYLNGSAIDHIAVIADMIIN